MCTDQQENSATLRAVIFQDAFRKGRAVIGAPTQEIVQIHSHQVILQSIARIHTSNVGAERTLQSLNVALITESVVAVRIRAEVGIVAFGGEHQGRATSPSADHLRRDQFLSFGGRRLLAQVFPKGGYPRVEFTKSQKSSVPPQDLGLWTCCHVP